GFCLVASAKDKAIEEFTLDEQTVYPIRVATDRVTTVSFPGPISAIDAAQASTDPHKLAPFQIAYTKGSAFFSVRALAKKVRTNMNIRWKNKTYVLELSEGDEPVLSVIFQYQPETAAGVQSVALTPSRLLALLDKAKAYPLLVKYHPDAVGDVQYRNYDKQPRIVDCSNYSIRIDEVFRFDAEDTLIFRVSLKNKTGVPLRYAPNGFSLRVGERTYPQSVSDAGGFIPPQAEIPAYFAVTGTPNGGRNDISVKNDFYVILEAQPAEAKGGAQ
ncbi:MAG TPA: hypothetical protein VGN61_13190, partial [Verrucomicrobiae bacterium]